MEKNPKLERFDWICDGATDTDGMTAKETAQFHYFNTNGLIAELRKASDTAINSGYISAVFTTRWPIEEISELVNQKKPRWRRVRVFRNTVRMEIDSLNEKIG